MSVVPTMQRMMAESDHPYSSWPLVFSAYSTCSQTWTDPTLVSSTFNHSRLLRLTENTGNAKTAGLDVDIHLKGNQYGNAVTFLYATYVPFEAPAAILLKIIGPTYLLSFCAFAWGLCCMCTAFVEDVGGLYTVRLLTGLFEAGLIPCINVYLSMVYKKSERGKRSSVIFAFSAFASAFGGLLAYGLTQIHSGGYLNGWRILFLFEGLLTIVVVPIFFFGFPKTPQTAWFLTEEEKRMIAVRYQQNSHWGIDEKFSWGEVIKVLRDPKWYAL